MRVNLIRHGMTMANEKRQYCGRTDLPLSELGKKNLTALKGTIVYPPADLYISSGMKRATETLQIIYDRAPDIFIEEFTEMDFGDFELKSYNELKNKPDYQFWINNIDIVACTNGENRIYFNDRVFDGFSILTGMNTGSAAVVCHGGVIVSIMERLFPGQKNFYEWQPGYGRGYALDVTSKKAALVTAI